MCLRVPDQFVVVNMLAGGWGEETGACACVYVCVCVLDRSVCMYLFFLHSIVVQWECVFFPVGVCLCAVCVCVC